MLSRLQALSSEMGSFQMKCVEYKEQIGFVLRNFRLAADRVLLEPVIRLGLYIALGSVRSEWKVVDLIDPVRFRGRVPDKYQRIYGETDWEPLRN